MTNSPLGGLDTELVSRTLLDAAEIAAEHTLPRFRSGLAVDNKLTEGFDPVTEADREARRVDVRHRNDGRGDGNKSKGEGHFGNEVLEIGRGCGEISTVGAKSCRAIVRDSIELIPKRLTIYRNLKFSASLVRFVRFTDGNCRRVDAGSRFQR